MSFLPRKWLRSLWGVTETSTEIAPPIDCDDCRTARAAGRDACAVHGEKHARPHVYDFGHEVSWGSPFNINNDALPYRHSESIH